MNKITLVEEGHKYFNEHDIEVVSVSEILEHFGISDVSMIDGRVLEAASSFGTVVHDTTRLNDIDDLESCDPQIQPYLDQWNKFKEDNNIAWDDFSIIEQPLYSTVWGYAGTPDRVCSNILVDIKSGAETVAHRIQLALYQILVEENTDTKIKERWTVYLKPDSYKVVEHKDKTDLNIAKSLVSLYNWKKKEKLL